MAHVGGFDRIVEVERQAAKIIGVHSARLSHAPRRPSTVREPI
jgi:hypothetical protein